MPYFTFISSAVDIIPYANLFAYYRFNSNGNDETGSYNGTVTGSSYVTGKIDNAIQCDVTGNEYMKIADADAFSFGNGTTDVPFSISFWIKSPSASAYLLVKRDAPAGKEYSIGTDASAEIQVLLWDQSTGGYIGVTTSGISLGSTNFHKVTITYDGGGAYTGITVYKDGVSQSIVNTSGGSYTAMENGTQPVKLGARWSTTVSSNGAGADFDMLSFWDKELTQEEETAIYNKENSGTYVL